MGTRSLAAATEARVDRRMESSRVDIGWVEYTGAERSWPAWTRVARRDRTERIAASKPAGEILSGAKDLFNVVGPEGFEPPTKGL